MTETTINKGQDATDLTRITSRRIDGRTRLAKRARELADAFAEELGGWGIIRRSPTMHGRVLALGQIEAICELARVHVLNGHAAAEDVDQMVRLENLRRREAAALGLASPPRQPVALSLDAYLANREETAA